MSGEKRIGNTVLNSGDWSERHGLEWKIEEVLREVKNHLSVKALAAHHLEVDPRLCQESSQEEGGHSRRHTGVVVRPLSVLARRPHSQGRRRVIPHSIHEEDNAEYLKHPQEKHIETDRPRN